MILGTAEALLRRNMGSKLVAGIKLDDAKFFNACAEHCPSL